jgi:hypothetical protein
MVRTGAAKTKQCCEHMISATTTRELSTGLDESAGKAHIAWTSDCNRRCRRLRSVHPRHERTTPRAPSEMVTWWTPGSPAPGAATEQTELSLEGNPYSPLPSRLRGGRQDRARRTKRGPPRQVTEALSASGVARGAPSVAPRPRMPGVPLSIGVRVF